MDDFSHDHLTEDGYAFMETIVNKLEKIRLRYVEQGKKVFVISCGSTSYWTSTKDGVRYINLPDLWKADGTVNPNYKMLRFRVKDGAVTYEAVHIK